MKKTLLTSVLILTLTASVSQAEPILYEWIGSPVFTGYELSFNKTRVDRTNAPAYDMATTGVVTVGFTFEYAAIPSIKGYGSWGSEIAYAYTDININAPIVIIKGNYYIIQRNGLNFPVDEIEINPADGRVYAIGNSGSDKALFWLAPNIATGYADAVYMGKLFHSFSRNGYKSGSIAFVETSPNSNTWYLAYTTESTVYASQGIVVWSFILGPNQSPPPAGTYPYLGSYAPGRSYANFNPQTGNINTVSFYGELYFARDNGLLYKLDKAVNNTVYSAGSVPQAANDFGPMKNF